MVKRHGRAQRGNGTAEWLEGRVLLSAGDFAFRLPVQQPLDSQATGVIAADVDGDGKQDLVTVHFSSSTVSVLHNQGGGSFSAGAVYFVGAGPKAVVAADLDGDGKPELITADADGGTVSVLRNRGDGTFAPAVAYAAGGRAMYVTAADVNNDGKIDIVAGIDSDTTAFTVLPNAGDGTLGAGVSYAGLSQRYWYAVPMEVVPADLDGDGYVDLIAGDWAGGFCPIYQNQGDGTFVLKQSINAGMLERVGAADVNGDGRVDLLTASSADTDGLRVWLNGGDWQFARQEALLAGSNIAAFQASDVTGDGRMDLVAATTAGNVAVLRNTGDGIFVQDAVYVGFSGGSALAVADVTGDGRPDSVVAANTSLSIIGSRSDGGYGAPSAVFLGTQAWWNVAADFNGDGRTDLGAYSMLLGSMRVATNAGNGRFAVPVDTLLRGFSDAAASADFDGDGYADVVVMGQYAELQVLLNDRDGTFTAKPVFNRGTSPGHIATADMDADGRPDIVVANWDSTRQDVVLSVWLGRGDGTFAQGSSRTLVDFSGLSALGAADVDSDGWADVILTRGDGDISIFRNLGAGQLASAATRVAVDTHLSDLVVQDLNNDGHADLAVLDDSYVNTVERTRLSVLLSDGRGGWAAPVQYEIGRGVYGLAAADLNGDGYLDLALNPAMGASSLLVLGNRGDGSFAPAVSTGIPARRLGVADLDGDGRQDLVYAADSSVNVLYNGLTTGFVPTVTLARPLAAQENNVLVDFRLSDAGSQPCNVDVQYSTDGGKTWNLATAGRGSAPTVALASDPLGRTYRFVWNAGHDIGPASNQLVQVKLTASNGRSGMPVVSEARVVDVAPEPAEPVQLQAGKTIRFTDVDGDPVSIRLTGQGSGVVQLGPDMDSVEWIDLSGTTSKSALSITVSGRRGRTTVGAIRLLDGQLGAITAPTTDLDGEGIIGSSNSYIRQIRLGNIFSNARLYLPGTAPSGSMTIAAGSAYLGAHMTFGMPVRLASFVALGAGELNAPQIGKLVVTGVVQNGYHQQGSLDASLNVGGAGIDKALGSVVVDGPIGGIWKVAGAIGTINATDTRSGWQLHAAGAVGRLRIGQRLAGDIEAAAIMNLAVGGDVDEASVQLGGSGISRPLGSASIGGTIHGGAWEVAGAIGSLTAGEVESGLEPWRLHASGTIGQLRVRGTLRGAVSAQSVGKMWVGADLKDADVALGTAGVTEGRTVLGSLYVGQGLLNSVLGGWGDLGAISARAILQTTIVAGADPSDDPWTTGQLSSTSEIKSLRIRGLGEGSAACYGSRIAAGRIGNVTVVNPDRESPSAILAHAVGTVNVKQWLVGRSQTLKWGRQDQPGAPMTLVEGLTLQIV